MDSFCNGPLLPGPVQRSAVCLFRQQCTENGNTQERDKLKYRQCGLNLCNFQIKNKIAKLKDCHWMIYDKRETTSKRIGQ